MPGRGPQTFKKRQKEQERRERQQEKMAKRLQRKTERSTLEDADLDTALAIEQGVHINPNADDLDLPQGHES